MSVVALGLYLIFYFNFQSDAVTLNILVVLRPRSRHTYHFYPLHDWMLPLEELHNIASLDTDYELEHLQQFSPLIHSYRLKIEGSRVNAFYSACSRCVLIYGVYTVWARCSSAEGACAQALENRSWDQEYNSSPDSCSEVIISSWSASLTVTDKPWLSRGEIKDEWMSKFQSVWDSLDNKYRCNIINPSYNPHDIACPQGTSEGGHMMVRVLWDAVSGSCFLCRERARGVAVGPRKRTGIFNMEAFPISKGSRRPVSGILKVLDLHRLPFPSLTALPAEIALLMANMAGATFPGARVLDPFCGCGALLAAAATGQACTKTPTRMTASTNGVFIGTDIALDKSKIDANFASLGLAPPHSFAACTLTLANDESDTDLRRFLAGITGAGGSFHGFREGCFDAIVTDPPYDMMAKVSLIGSAPSQPHHDDRLDGVVDAAAAAEQSSSSSSTATITSATTAGVAVELGAVLDASVEGVDRQALASSAAIDALLHLSARLLRPGGRLVFFAPQLHPSTHVSPSTASSASSAAGTSESFLSCSPSSSPHIHGNRAPGWEDVQRASPGNVQGDDGGMINGRKSSSITASQAAAHCAGIGCSLALPPQLELVSATRQDLRCALTRWLVVLRRRHH